FSVPGPDPATLLLESSANTPSSLRSDGHSGETPSTKSITRSNGRELQVFNAFLKDDLAAKRVLRLDLLAFNSDDEFEAVYAQVRQLSRASMTAPSGVRTWMHQRRMDALVRRLLATPGSAPVRALEEALAEAEIPATTQDLMQWFRVHLGAGVITLPTASGIGVTATLPTPSPEVGTGVALPAPQDDVPFKDVDPGEEVGRLRALVETGLLPAGTVLTLSRAGKAIVRGEVNEHGRIVVDGVAHRSPSDKTFARALGRRSVNGWRAWRADLPGGPVPLDELRERLAAGAGVDATASASAGSAV
ncbi:MAG: hypothetical protein M3R02_08015, partial [Chloroflexota bacterium]|nr:hypothetical protein [Chloroflexota bacterium]